MADTRERELVQAIRAELAAMSRLCCRNVEITVSLHGQAEPALLESYELRPEQVEIEITESLFIQDQERVKAELAVFHGANVHIALDDFGTGYSSLNMLRSLPLNTVKIDRSFIAPLRESAGARKVAEKIIEMVAALELSVVAEGVEHWQEVSLVERLGRDYIQGYVLAEPLALEALVSYLKRVQAEGVRAEYRVIAAR